MSTIFVFLYSVNGSRSMLNYVYFVFQSIDHVYDVNSKEAQISVEVMRLEVLN